jgi:DNA-3-methyladenine glycosylase II
MQKKTLSLNEDPVLSSIMARIPEPIVTSSNNVFHDLMSCIIEQQIHYRSTKNIFKNLLTKAGINELTLENFHAFDEKALQFIKISMRKTETINRICVFFHDNPALPWHELSDDEIRQKLSSIAGVGTWTIDMILLYTLGRKTIFPVDDFRLKQVMLAEYGLNEASKLKAQMNAIAEKWGNEQSLAVLYLLAHYEHLKGRKS